MMCIDLFLLDILLFSIYIKNYACVLVVTLPKKNELIIKMREKYDKKINRKIENYKKKTQKVNNKKLKTKKLKTTKNIKSK